MHDDLEDELARLTPLPPSGRLENRLGAALAYRASGATSSLADTLLRCLLSLGAAAAVVIVTVLASDWTGSSPATSPPAISVVKKTDTLTIADTPRLLARLSDPTSAGSPAIQN